MSATLLADLSTIRLERLTCEILKRVPNFIGNNAADKVLDRIGNTAVMSNELEVNRAAASTQTLSNNTGMCSV